MQMSSVRFGSKAGEWVGRCRSLELFSALQGLGLGVGSEGIRQLRVGANRKTLRDWSGSPKSNLSEFLVRGRAWCLKTVT